MKILKICKQNKVIRDMSHAEAMELAKAFNRAKKPISSIVRLLESEIVAIDNKLNDTEGLYEKSRADLYTAALLAERACLMRYQALLTATIDVDPTEI